MMIQTTEQLRGILERLPESPGVYQYLDEKGIIIYVGKAKNLKRRVHSYFNKNHEDSPKTKILVRKICDIKYIVVETEMDALLLENNLIKQHQPRYNVLLKDDKTYPSICIKKENFPRVFATRKISYDGSEYFGPYSSIIMVRTLLDLLKQLYPIRSCKLALEKESIEQKKYKECLNYHIKKCKAPCVGRQSASEYNEQIEQIREILKGNLNSVARVLRKNMENCAHRLEFEQAQEWKEKIQLLEQYRSKSYIVNTKFYQVDVFSYLENESEDIAIVNYMNIVQGNIVQSYTFEYKKRIEEDQSSILASAIYEMRQRFKSESKTIIVPFMPYIELREVNFIVPKRGDARKVLDLSERNVRQYTLELQKQADKLNPEQKTTRLLNQVKTDLQLDHLPIHIECFDNSNIQGTYPVASCVVFKKGKPSKKDYRHFGIKTVVGANDFASMEEILTRRYSRLLREEQALPQLVIVDGGKGQLSSAVHAMNSLVESEFNDRSESEKKRLKEQISKIQLIGLAKKLEEIYYPNDSIPLYLDKRSDSLKLIQQLRDEAHRFGISYHRKIRSKGQIKSELDSIPQIGEATKTKLLRHFKSIKRIKESKLDELVSVVGKAKAKVIAAFYQIK